MMTNSAGGPRYSIVVPVFNEQAVLPVLLRRLDLLMAGLDGVAETIFVDDGSADTSSIILAAKKKLLRSSAKRRSMPGRSILTATSTPCFVRAL